MSATMKDLHALGLNPFAVQLLAESMLKSAYVKHCGTQPLTFAYLVQREDCAGWLGVRITIEAVSADKQPQAEAVPLTQAALDVLAERQRQIRSEGWTAKHDDEHKDGSMALAAACYACNAATWADRPTPIKDSDYQRLASPGFRWPWAMKWWKPKSQRQDLVKAGALILAEIERLDRAAIAQQKGSAP